MLKFIRNWALPLAMVTGTIAYFIFAAFPALDPAKPVINSCIAWLIPFLIFAQLLMTFCKVRPQEFLPSAWHIWLILFQLIAATSIAAVLVIFPQNGTCKELLEGAMVCLICPTATAAAVITAKLGGSASSLTTYTLLSNVCAAIMVPLLFPLVEPHANITFFDAFLKILTKVLPLLIFPFLLAMLFRYCLPKIHRFLLGLTDLAFYLWCVALVIVTAQTVKSLVTSDAPWGAEVALAATGLVVCVIQFALGKSVGSRFSDRISAGQALGQKNTVLAIWMAYTYLDPISSVVPGSYVLWQNFFNSWQLWKKRKREERAASAV